MPHNNFTPTPLRNREGLLTAILAVVLLTGCASWGDIAASGDGCAVWNIAIPDPGTAAQIRNVVVTACAPTIAEQVRSIRDQIGEIVSVDDVHACKRESCPEAAKRMLRDITSRRGSGRVGEPDSDDDIRDMLSR